VLKFKTDRPVAFYDIEATGTNPRADRIIDLAVVKIAPDGGRQDHHWRVNPERPIPPDSSAIHGITDEDVKNAPTFKDIAPHIAGILEGCDLAGYNIIHYDIPMLTEEFIRAGVPFSLEGRRVLDAQRIYHKREPRDLSAALKFYCSEMHLGAHGALDDVLATIRVVEGQFERYPDLSHDMTELHNYCNPRNPSWVDGTGKLKWVDGEVTINFGKSGGKKLRDMVTDREGQGFLRWLLKSDFPRDTKEIVQNAMLGKFPKPPVAENADA
jgi:DNA polymerase-3 subunit epsilon